MVLILLNSNRSGIKPGALHVATTPTQQPLTQTILISPPDAILSGSDPSNVR